MKIEWDKKYIVNMLVHITDIKGKKIKNITSRQLTITSGQTKELI